jgi:hypothetical protein
MSYEFLVVTLGIFIPEAKGYHQKLMTHDS